MTKSRKIPHTHRPSLSLSSPINRSILRIALPSIVSNITVPLLGLVDTAISGHLGNAAYIGAIAVGGVIFNIVYWLFVFLRLGTSGLTAQALGAGHQNEITYSLFRSLSLAIVIAILLIILQWPILMLTNRLMNVSPHLADLTATYFYICIWGAPAVLMLYALNGWFVGMQNSRIPMAIAIVQNVMNIPLSLLFVFGAGLKVEGIALGTVVAQYVGLFTALWLLCRNYRQYLVGPKWREILRKKDLMQFLHVNRDIMLRMVCMLMVVTWFTAAGARMGDTILAANAILFQLFYLFSYFFDGFANAAEAICGRSYGAGDAALFRLTVKRVTLIGLLLVAVFSIAYVVLKMPLLRLLTSEPTVVAAASRYFVWVALVPVCGIMAFVLDGVFVGATATGRLLMSMASGTAAFFISYFILFPVLGNDGLWISFLLYLLFRSLTEIFLYPALRRSVSAH